MCEHSGDSYSSTQFYIEGGYPSASSPIGQPALPGSTTSGGLNWVGLVTSELNSSLLLTYDWAYYGADTSNAIINTVSLACSSHTVSGSSRVGREEINSTTHTGVFPCLPMIPDDLRLITSAAHIQGVTTDFIAQVGEFEEYLVPAPSQAPWTAANTLAAVWLGINDVGECFWESSVYATCPIAQVMTTYFGLLDRLYADGVRNYVLLMVPRALLSQFPHI